jgi:hypothetical protein
MRVPVTSQIKLIFLGLLLCRLISAQIPIQDLSDPNRGRLSGVVLDELGKPLPGMVVTATPPGPIAAILPNTRTDSQGHFALAGLVPGHTGVMAGNEGAFYPQARSNFWDGQGAAQVEVPIGGEISGIQLTVRPVGRLEVRAINTDTGLAIDLIDVRIERDGAPDRWMEGGTLGNWWLVPTAPIRFRVRANGFQPAWYGASDGSMEKSVPITLTPRQILVVQVPLHPLPK